MRSRQYYECLSDQQLVGEAQFEAKSGRPQPELLAVLAERFDETLDEVRRLEDELEALAADPGGAF